MSKAVKEYLSVLRLAIDRHPKHIIAMESDTLIKLFIQLFDFRRIQLSPPTEDSYVLEEIDETESAVSDCAIAMVHKLNDATFRPLFLQVTGWASPSSSSGVGNSTIYRLTAVYTFVYKFFDRLKASFTGLFQCASSSNVTDTVDRDKLRCFNIRGFCQAAQIALAWRG